MQSTVIQRLNEFKESQGLSTNKLAQILEVSQSSLNDFFTGKSTRVSINVIEKALIRFPIMSAEWLMRGEGTMLRELEQTTSSKLDEALNENNMISELLNKMNIEELVREEIRKQLNKKA